MSDKPHKGSIRNWSKIPCGMGPLRCYVWGEFVNHPDFGNKTTNTSYLVSHDEATGEIETRNSRYTLIGAETKIGRRYCRGP